jgi:hypothetical protein
VTAATMTRHVTLLVLGAASLLGCPPQDLEAQVSLVQQTQAPPTQIASLTETEDERLVRMGTGVAMAVGCWASCPDDDDVDPGYECATFNVTSADPNLVEIHDVFSNRGTPTKVLAAKAPGQTTLTVRTPCGTSTYDAIID